jgi:peptidoglycan/LPS O-acetylase OafA/YrhL
MKNIISKRLQELDALRGIAVILVVIFHITMENKQPKGILALGVTGVDLFFVISGFVILLTLEKTQSWQDFIVSRFSRLYPVYWFSVTIIAILMLVTNFVDTQPSIGMPIKYLANMTMFQNYFKINDLDGVFWTLKVEMVFYLFMLVIFMSKNIRNIEIISCIALLPVIGYHLLLNTKFHVLHMRLENHLPLLGHFPMFFAGILFYKMKFEKINWYRYLLIVLCFIIQYILFFDGGRSYYFISQPEYGLMLTVYFTLFILYGVNRLSFIVNRVTLFLGNISYSLYLLHGFIGSEVVIPGLMKYAHLNIWVASIVVTLPILLIIATLTNKYIEKPAMNYIRKKYRESNSLSTY